MSTSPTAIPQTTPYDITDIPYFPYEPHAFEWILLISTTIIIIAGWYGTEKIRTRFNQRRIRVIERELAALKESMARESTRFAELSLLLRRYLSLHFEETEISALSTRELEALQSHCERPLFIPLIESLTEIEKNRFQPECQLDFSAIVENAALQIKTIETQLTHK